MTAGHLPGGPGATQAPGPAPGDHPSPPPARRSPEPGDAVVAVAVVATAVLWFTLTRGSWFYVDEWVLATRVRTPGDLLHSYNGHLSVTYLLVYRAHVGLFGLDGYGLLRAVGITALAAIPALLHLTTRRRLGVVGAGVAALAVLWMRGVSLEPGAMNHSAVVALAVVTAWALGQRTARADAVVAVTLVLGFLTAGGTVAVAAGAVVHAALTRAPLTRWAAVVVPTAAWYGWYRWEIGSVEVPEAYRLSRWESARLVVEGQMATLDGMVLGSRAGGIVLGIALVGVAAWRVWVHRGAAVAVLATWGAASAVWWIGLASSRGVLADPETYRYRLAAAVFTVLALVPPHETTDDAAARREAALWRRLPLPSGPWPGAAALGLVAIVLVVGGLGPTRDGAQQLEDFGRAARLRHLVAFADTPVAPRTGTYPLVNGALDQVEMAQLRAWYGPSTPSGAALDRALVDAGAVNVVVTGPAPDGPCRARDEAAVSARATTVVAGDEAVTVTARRFGEEPVAVGEVPAGSAATVWLFSDDPAPQPWVVDAPGACTPGG